MPFLFSAVALTRRVIERYNVSMSSYEIEIKSLLGEKEHADALVQRLHEHDADTKLVDENSQLNHYFHGGDMNDLYESVKSLFDDEQKKKLEHVIKDGSEFSIRTRLINDDVLKFVVKASIGDDTSAHGVSRIEFEEEVKEMTLDDLDKMLLDAGFSYQAKWSRSRKEYSSNGMSVCIDKNAGYGYLAEFEKIVDDPTNAEMIESELRTFMNIIGCEEMPQDRLDRMFAHYNQNWPDYYGTEKVFIIL